MDYKKMMGYGTKNKVTKKVSKPKTNKIIENLQEQFGELHETLPAYPKEWKMLEKACYDLEKAVVMLSKSVGRQDKSAAKTIVNSYKTLQKSIKGYKEMLKKHVLSRLQ